MKNQAKGIIFLAIFSFFLKISFAQPPRGGGLGKTNTDHIKNKWLDVPYATKSPAQKLDIYLPNEGNGTFPVIISIHGGAFMMGDKADGQLKGMIEGVKRGYAVVSVNYRMSGEAIFPADIQDVKAAIRWVRANAQTYKLNPDKIATWGGSAGGHLAAFAGVSDGVKLVDDLTLGNEKMSSKVQAVVDWFGPIDFLEMDKQFKISGKGKPDHDEVNSPESKLLGKKITDAPELVKASNPTTYISKDDCPFFIEHGKEDQLVPTEQSINFAASLEKILGKDKVTLTLLDGTRHGGPQFETPENLEKVFTFLDKYLK